MADSQQTKRPAEKPQRPETGALASRIRRAKGIGPGKGLGKAAANAMRQNELTGAGRAFRMASEFVAAVIVAAALGMALDAVFGTRPIFMIVLLLLGFAAGVLNVTRAAAEMNAAAPKPDPDKLVPVDADDDDD
jgi:ATP synthase protein I